MQIEPELDFDLIKETLVKDMEKRKKSNLIEENLKAIQAGIDWYLGEKAKH